MAPPVIFRGFMFVIYFCSASLLSAEKQTHEINGISEVTLDEAWEFKPVDPMITANPTRINHIGIFHVKGDNPFPVIVTCIIGDLPRGVILPLKLDEIAQANAKTMISKITKNIAEDVEVEIGKLTLKEAKKLGMNRSTYTQEIGEKGKKPVIVSGVVWKTDSRTYCLQTVLTNKDPQNIFWTYFLKDWKNLTGQDELYAESYRNHSKFLTAEQKEKLPKVLEEEGMTDLELKFMADALAKKEDQETRENYNRSLRQANARKMRLIYYRILDEEQKVKFDQSIKRRMKKR